jgi:cytochrome b561
MGALPIFPFQFVTGGVFEFSNLSNQMNSYNYSARQKVLHWISAVVILWTLLSGFYVAVFTVSAAVKAWVGFFNVSLTTVYIPIFVVRVSYSFAHGLDFSAKRSFSEYMALLVHKSMYLVLAVVLITGVLMMDRPINIFHLFSIAPVANDPATIVWFTQVHILSCVVLLLLVGLHIGAVVMHETRGKRVMRRMVR